MIRLTFALVALYSSLALALPYNEVFDEDERLRDPYFQFLQRNYHEPSHGREAMSLIFPQWAEANLLLDRPIGDAIKILPTPVILSPPEYELIQRAGAQRARTYVEFFDDVVHHHGTKLLAAGIMTSEELRALFSMEQQQNGSYGNYEWLANLYRNIDRNHINFWLGPDFVRDESGEFKVIEDNIGQLGGTNDVYQTQSAFMRLRMGRDATTWSPLQAAIERFLADIPRKLWASDVIAILPPIEKQQGTTLVDEEGRRRRETIREMGIETVTWRDFDDSSFQVKLLSGQFKKIINTTDIVHLFNTWSPINSLLQGYVEGHWDMLTSPGLGTFSNKAVLAKFDALTRLYLGEEPLIKTAATNWVRCTQDIDAVLFRLNRNANLPCMVKQSIGNRGQQVYFLQYLNSTGAMSLTEQIMELNAKGHVQTNMDLPHFIYQEYIDQSYVPAGPNNSWVRFLVDFRPLTYVFHGEPDNQSLLWGRAVLKTPNALTNVSAGGMETVVFTPQLCADILARKK